jgi:hypothetical protein
MNDPADHVRASFAWIVVVVSGWMLASAPQARASEIVVTSGTGLEIEMSVDGSVSGVKVEGRRVDGARGGGFFLRLDGADEWPRATVERSGKDAHLRLDWPERGLSGTALITGEALAIAVHGEIVDRTGKDRAVTLSFELPVGPEGAGGWWDDIDHSRRISGAGVFENVVRTPAGATGTHSPYPLACVSGSEALAMGIQLEKPVLHRLWYSAASGRLGVSFDFALTAAAKRTPSRAAFDFVIFPVDPLWGFRSALERYYAVLPAAFERRVHKLGGWVAWGDLKTVPDFTDYGFRYHWGPAAAGLAFDGTHGVYTFLYSDSGRYFSDLGRFDRKPDRAATSRAFRELLDSADPRGVLLGRPPTATGRLRFEAIEREMGPEKAGAWLRKAIAAVRVSATTDADGEFNVGYVLSRKDWGPENWWTGRLFCNLDPAISGGFGTFLLDDIFGRIFPSARTAGGSYDGVALDNYFVDADTLDFRPEHVAVSEGPLTFSHEGSKAVVVGDFSTFAWVKELSRRLRKQGGWVMANAVSIPYPFAASVLDIHGYEWNLMDFAPLARALAYHKPVVTLPVKEEHYQEAFLRKHVRFGFVPGGYADKRFATDATLRALYKRYVPALVRCAEAGWEPVTEATSEDAAIKVERFGRPGGPIFLSVTNTAASPRTGRIRLDAGRLRVPRVGFQTPDLIDGKIVSWAVEEDSLVASIRMTPGEAVVLEIAR